MNALLVDLTLWVCYLNSVNSISLCSFQDPAALLTSILVKVYFEMLKAEI